MSGASRDPGPLPSMAAQMAAVKAALGVKPESRGKVYLDLTGIDYQSDDDAPVVKTPRARSTDPRDRFFQPYAHKLFHNYGQKSVKNMGRPPDAMDVAAAALRDQILSQKTDIAISDSAIDAIEGNIAQNAPAVVAEVSQAMPKAFSVGSLSWKAEAMDLPRTPTPESAWVFNDAMLAYFVLSKVPREAWTSYMKDPNAMTGLASKSMFGMALKTYVCLYQYFRVGQTDESLLADGTLSHVTLWNTVEAVKCFRYRRVTEGVEMFGTPENPTDHPAGSRGVPKKLWSVFMRVYWRALVQRGA